MKKVPDVTKQWPQKLIQRSVKLFESHTPWLGPKTIRASITGQLSGPELDQVTEVIGQERVIKRLKEASAL